MRNSKTEAFVLKKKRLLNKDLLLTLFTSDFGKISIIAKGARKITSRRLPHIQTGNLLNIVLNKKMGKNYLQETSLISAFSKIKGNSAKLNYQYFLFFILDRLLPESEQELEIYNLVKKFLVELSNSRQFSENDMTDYLNLIMKKLGYTKEKQSLSKLLLLIEDLINEKTPLYVI